MSGQWEIVGKKKEKGSKDSNQKTGPQVSKKNVENLNLKVEDVLAKSQVKNLYSSGKNKENKPLEIKKVLELGSKKVQKKQEKPSELPKPKAPKSIESALNQIDADEFKNVFENSKAHFPEAPIVWLKELAQFLNQRVNVELQDPVFSSKPQNFPLVAVPPKIKSVIETALQEADKGNVQLFFDISLSSMATDMSKNLPALGHKLFLQLIALNEPNLVSVNLAKHCVLRTSYQNRPNIGLSILWAVGQAGINNFEAGLMIFQDLMLPLIELKSYSRYVVKYLIDLISHAKQVSLTREQFVFILDIIFSNKKNFPTDLKQNLLDVIPHLKSFLFSTNQAETSSLEVYLKKIESSGSDLYQECLCDVIIKSFSRDPNILDHWCKIYTQNITSSAILLKYLDHNWKNLSSNFNRKVFTVTVNQIAVANKELGQRKKKNEGLVEATHLAQKILEKMSEKRRSRLSFKFWFFTTFLIVTSLIYYDIVQEGSWQKSTTKRILKSSGISEYTHKFSNRIQQGFVVIDEQIEDNFPIYRRTVIEFSEPYIELTGNLGRIFYNIFIRVKETVLEKYPVVIQSIESYAPGFVDQSQNAIHSAWSSSVYYFSKSINYLREEVFVGQLSPENMQRVVFEAFNTTQNKATEYYHWIYEKVQSAIK